MTTHGIAEELAQETVLAQSLATGAVGDALLAVERALAGDGDWDTVRQLIQHTVSGPVDAAAHSGLYYGAPAVLLLLHSACADGRERYGPSRESLTGHVRRLVHHRLAEANARLDGRRTAAFAEYDLFYGLVGFGALLLRILPDSDELADILTFVVRLSEPRGHNGEFVPGWWVDHDPDPLLPTPGGHANAGTAHGAAGLLALLALTARRGITVAAHREAIERLNDWFDQWRQEDGRGIWWPQWITRADLAARRPIQPGPGRPSWCYGTPGIARALQLAAIAIDQPKRQVAAEAALAGCLDDLRIALLDDPGVCHGLAGLYQTAFRAAADSGTPIIAARLPVLAARLATAAGRPEGGFLTGEAGLHLAARTARNGVPPLTRWDTCLLIA